MCGISSIFAATGGTVEYYAEILTTMRRSLIGRGSNDEGIVNGSMNQ